MTIICKYSQLPETVTKSGEIFIMEHNDLLQHPYNSETQKWLAHCTNPGCGEYYDDMEDIPATDFLCPDCEAQGINEE